MNLLYFLRRIGGLRRLLYDRRSRSVLVTRWTQRNAVHQYSTQTWLDRYPRLFALARSEIIASGPPTILSFGCSSGEEVVSLRRYFPEAELIGAEINAAQLAACARLPADSRTTFIRSNQDAIAARGPYDAIFCMAILQRLPHEVERHGITNIAKRYPFALFSNEVKFLANQLRTGGLLVIDHCQYCVENVAAPLTPVMNSSVYHAKGPRFDPGGALISPQPIVARMFRRLDAREETAPTQTNAQT